MRVVVAAALLVAVLLLITAPAGVGDDNFDAEVNATPTATGVVFGVEAWSDGGVVPVGANPLRGCTIIGNLTGGAAIDYAGARGIVLGITDPELEGSEQSYVFISCPDRVFNGFNWAVWEEGEPPPSAVIDALAAAARSAIAVPDLTPQTAPDGLATPFLTQLPVWLWVPEASWVPVSGTASLPEIGLAVTATATPIETTWRTGATEDGTDHGITCGAGTPWAPGLDDSATDCSTVYEQTTPPGTSIDLSVTTTYDIAFACTPGLCDPAAIALPGLAITVARPVTVTEARGVIIG